MHVCFGVTFQSKYRSEPQLPLQISYRSSELLFLPEFLSFLDDEIMPASLVS